MMLHMRIRHLQRVDLNLLVALAVLLEERHVSRAADRIGLSQPATSRALQRLRVTLGDELLVRTRDGYQLTPRAVRVQQELAGVLPRLELLFAGERFDPHTATDTFRLAGTDYAASVLGPGLFQRMFRQAPATTLVFGTWHDGVLADVERGVVDLVFFGFRADAALRAELLYEEHFVCLLADDHPLAAVDPLPLGDFLTASHAVVSVRDGEQSAVDSALTGLGERRTPSLTVPYHTAAVRAVAGTPLVATLPARLLADVPLGTTVVDAPREIATMPYLMSWHPRLDDDPAQRWLRDLVRVVAATT